MSSLENWQRALAVSGLGTTCRHFGIPACVDPQIDRPAAGTDGNPVAALCDGNRLVLRQLRRSEDLVARHQHGILPREREARLDQELAAVRGVDGAVRSKAGCSRWRIARLRGQ